MAARRRLNSRAKGARIELMFAHLLQTWGHPAWRTAQRSGRGGGPFDVECPSLPIPHWEVKGEEALNLPAAMDRAAEDAGDRFWGLAWRKKRKPWLFVFTEDQFRRLLENMVPIKEVRDAGGLGVQTERYGRSGE